jgi:antitoxin MazE
MQISRWGNSLGVRLPKALVDRLGLKPGDEIDIVAASRERLEVARDDRRAAALARMQARGWKAPAGYRFDREDANRR